jgi:hypothetical protein
LAPSPLLPTDRSELEARGIEPGEAERQLALLADPPPSIVLIRPCTPGDGIQRLPPDREEELLALFDRARLAGRALSFVPASGAATRMFRGLLACLERGAGASRTELKAAAGGGDAEAGELLAFLEGLSRFAFREELEAELARRGEDLDALLEEERWEPALRALLEEEGLCYAGLPKGLIPFHRAGEGGRSALVEQLVDAAASLPDAEGRCRLHLTVAPGRRADFERALARARPALEARLGVRYEVGFSEQGRGTDTVAVEADGRPLRDGEGRLVLRPGGHGALIENLARLGGDLVFVKNIDNVVPEPRQEGPLRWRRLLGGLLVELQQTVFGYLERLEAGKLEGSALEEALAWVERWLGGRPGAGSEEGRQEELLRRLRRPLRVCGMVPNEGEPGGGPFWVRGPSGGESAQIVEASQVDRSSAEQRALLASATHFNPVDLVCGLRDREGRAFELRRFVDPATVFLSEKSWRGRPIRALEHPGLWNGAMAGWNTVFVEVPGLTFNPVKTVLDLLRPAHQPPPDNALG